MAHHLPPGCGQKQSVTESFHTASTMLAEGSHQESWRSQPLVKGHLKSFVTGLQQRQLDAIAYFLRKNESIFEAERSSFPDADTQPKTTSDDSLQLLSTIMDLVFHTVEDNSKQMQLWHFTVQMLHLVQNYLQKLTRSVISILHEVQLSGKATEASQKNAEHKLTVLTDYLEEVKGHIHTLEKSKSKSQSHSGVLQSQEERRMSCVLSDKQRHLVNLWDSLEKRAVTVEGILTGDLSLLQTYLRQRYGHEAADLTCILETGLEEGLAFIYDRDIASATNMFSNMGFNPDLKLHQICLYTVDRLLRDYLVGELNKTGKLTAEEQNMVEFVNKLESLYSCPSYTMARQLREEELTGSSSTRSAIDRVLSLLNKDANTAIDLLSECGDIGPCDIINSETSSYAEVILEWVRQWPSTTRQKIILEHSLSKKDCSGIQQSVLPAVVWEYLCCHLDTVRLQQWIRSQFSVTDADREWSKQVVWPFDQPITREMLSFLSYCPTFIKEGILDCLARSAVFVPWEQNDLHLVLQRLCKNGLVFQKPHLLDKYQTKHGINLTDIHYHVVKLCMEQRLPQLLYFYLDYWGLCKDTADLTEIGVSVSSVPPWVSLLLQNRLTADHLHDPMHIYNTSLLQDLSLPSVRPTCVRDMLEKNLILRAVATLAYCPEEYKKLTDEADEATVQLFSAYPQLRHAMFGDKLSTRHQTQPLTVYQLLENNVALDVTRLFGWQKTHTKTSDECFQSLPHFSHDPLVARYGHTETIDTEYYLQQGRACFAFCNMLSQLLHAEARSLPLSRITEECSQAFKLAVKNFTDQKIPPACVAFTEILGIDSAPLRLHLEVANAVLLYLNTALSNKSDKMTKRLWHYIASALEECVNGNTEYQRQVLMWLTSATYWKLKTLHINRVSVTAGFLWHLALLWCLHYNLALDSHFLVDCAKEDNWQLFLTFAQIFNYSHEQLFPIIKYFPCKNLRQHLVSVINTVRRQELDKQQNHSTEGPRRKTKPSSRLKDEKTLAVTCEDDDDLSVDEGGSDTSSISDEATHTVICTAKKRTDPHQRSALDLLTLLQDALQSDNPVHNLCTDAVYYKIPTPATLAACYQDHSLRECLLSWLLASVPEDCPPFCNDYCMDIWRHCSPDTALHLLSNLIDLLISQSMEYLLYRAFFIFAPDCELLPFLQFVASVKDDKEKDKCWQYLQCFKQLYHKLRSTTALDETCSSTALFSLTWLEDNVSKLIRQFLTSCNNMKRIKVFLQCVEESSILRFFHCKVINLSLLLKLHQVLNNTGMAINYVSVGDEDALDHSEACDYILNGLMQKKCFQEARLSAEILGIPHSNIILKQLQSELDELVSSDMWSAAENRSYFWNHCQEMMEKHRMAPQVAASYFLDLVSHCKSNSEKASVYKLAYDWLHQNSDTENSEKTCEVLVRLWMCKIHDHLEKRASGTWQEQRNGLNKNELLTLDPRRLVSQLTQRVTLTVEEEQILQAEIGQLLNRGSISEALRVTQTFGCDNKDFNIVTTCLKLAKGLLKPEDIDRTMYKMVTGPRQPSLRRISTTSSAFHSSLSMISISSLVNQFDSESASSDDAVSATIQILSQHAVHAKHCAAFILTAYNVSKLLFENFDSVLMLEDFTLIHRLLASDSANKLLLAKSYIVSAGIEDTQVASYLCDAIVEALQLWTGVIQKVTARYDTSKPIMLQPSIDQSGLRSNVGHGVQELLQLCLQPAVLGSKLLDTVTAMISANMVAAHNVFMVEVELLVYAHDCFTLSCHMEGISAVLRTARHLTEILGEADEFILMISLLIGLARYNEMTYVFDILKQQHQFELLFRKGIDRDARLRLAILDYLKRFHPDDLDTYSMAALNFTMYREIAGMLESEARKELAWFKDKPLENTGEAQSILKKALRYFSDAAESYVKDDCLRHAEKCVNEARLVALQTQLLSSKTSVLHLDREAVHKFVCSHPKFYESYIVCDAYNCHGFWSEAVYYQVIKAGSSRYLQEFRNHISLTTSVIQEVSERFSQENQPTKQMYSQMKKLLHYCQDLCMLHQMATRVGLSDVTKEMIKSNPMTEAYLKDVGLIKD